MMQKENFTPLTTKEYNKSNRNRGITVQNGIPHIDRPTTKRFCDDQKLQAYNDPNYISPNQRLVGGPNPKTLIPPVMVTPIMADEWKTNNLVVRSGINEESQQEAYQSGFQVSTCCGDMPNSYMVPVGRKKAGSTHAKTSHDGSGGCVIQNTPSRVTKANYVEYDGELYRKEPRPNQSGQVNVTCGYNPEQLFEAGLPTNLAAGNCERNPAMKRYNKNLFTQTIQPGMYQTSQVNEPINSNIGISYTQQLLPTSCETTEKGLVYTEHDPRILEPVFETPTFKEEITTENMYDPRHSGYGTSYRSYTDKKLGQTRYMYDDIDAIKMPNYITRSKIDVQPFADSYGPMKAGDEFGNKYNSSIRALANDAWMRSSIQQRTDIQSSLMRKTNNQKWQQRTHPIRTGVSQMSRTGGGGGGC